MLRLFTLAALPSLVVVPSAQSVVHVLQGLATNEEFGHSVDGDVDLDGTLDLIVGGAGFATVFSGLTGALLHTFGGCTSPFGSSVADVGDADADGLPDVGVHQNSSGCCLPDVSFFSGQTGDLLFMHALEATGFAAPQTIAGAGDVDGDGRPDLIAGSDLAENDGGLTSGAALVFRGCNGGIATYGTGLAGTGGLVPALTGSGCPIQGAQVTVFVADGLPGATGFSLIGTTPTAVPIFGGILLVLPVLIHGHVLSGEGTHDRTFTVPGGPGAVGTSLFWQSAYLDPGAPAGVSFANAIEIMIGAAP